MSLFWTIIALPIVITAPISWIADKDSDKKNRPPSSTKIEVILFIKVKYDAVEDPTDFPRYIDNNTTKVAVAKTYLKLLALKMELRFWKPANNGIKIKTNKNDAIGLNAPANSGFNFPASFLVIITPAENSRADVITSKSPILGTINLPLVDIRKAPKRKRRIKNTFFWVIFSVRNIDESKGVKITVVFIRKP